MEDVSKNPEISVQEAEEHYQASKSNYCIEGGESHLTYYRDKYPQHYAMLLNNVSPKT
ncbi:hypothetical protein [Costertonia aggregata]|uniref:Uncharacterized protein n=1 Tax=Costertonia aggregata TaxID=343403 RepID=A0A7H9AMS0_9FLAO|nr:hypothetical protein [Costertonia aggregata]QLG44684.1 hypothetical protein HYG79_04765 [Costertonia aggregata]